MQAVAVNGRFMRQSMTGVQRYAHEVSRRLADRTEILVPPKSGRLVGNLWEQFALPWATGGRLLWSPANTGPLAVEYQVVTIHDVSVLEHPEWFSPSFSSWYRFLIPRLARRARHLITDSEYSRERLIELTGVPPERVSVVHCGVDPRFTPASPEAVRAVRKRHGIPPRYVMALGSLEPRKNLSALLQAWYSLGPAREDVRLVIAGGKGSVFRTAALGPIRDSVILTGYVPDEDLPPMLSGAMAFVFPSLYEGFGLPALEAMACGTPVACTHTTSVPEVVGDAAILFDPGSIDEMGTAIGQLLEDEKRQQRLRQAGLARARRFSWDKAARLVWECLMAEARRGPKA